MSKKIAFTGTSGSGKTTMVQFVQKEYGLNHISGSSGDLRTKLDNKYLLDKYGYKGDEGHLAVIKRSFADPDFGLEMQEMIRVRRDELISNTDDFVTDRAPLDNWVFFLLQAAPFQNDALVQKFMDACLETASKLTHIIYIPAMLDQIENNQSRVPVLHYQKAVDAVFDRYWHVFTHHARVRNPSLRVLKVTTVELKQRQSQIMTFIKN